LVKEGNDKEALMENFKQHNLGSHYHHNAAHAHALNHAHHASGHHGTMHHGAAHGGHGAYGNPHAGGHGGHSAHGHPSHHHLGHHNGAPNATEFIPHAQSGVGAYGAASTQMYYGVQPGFRYPYPHHEVPHVMPYTHVMPKAHYYAQHYYGMPNDMYRYQRPLAPQNYHGHNSAHAQSTPDISNQVQAAAQAAAWRKQQQFAMPQNTAIAAQHHVSPDKLTRMNHVSYTNPTANIQSSGAAGSVPNMNSGAGGEPSSQFAAWKQKMSAGQPHYEGHAQQYPQQNGNINVNPLAPQQPSQQQQAAAAAAAAAAQQQQQQAQQQITSSSISGQVQNSNAGQLKDEKDWSNPSNWHKQGGPPQGQPQSVNASVHPNGNNIQKNNHYYGNNSNQGPPQQGYTYNQGGKLQYQQGQ